MIDEIFDMTPVQQVGPWLLKREDLFRPFAAPVNGSKLRQLIILLGRAYREGYRSVVTGASVLSPQVPMTAIVAEHFGMECHVILGGTREDTAFRHRGPALAREHGATFGFIPVGYNPPIQKAVGRVALERGAYQLHYGVSAPPDTTPADLYRLHYMGGRQVANLPRESFRLYMTLGSGNSLASVILGLETEKRQAELHLYAIGPPRFKWLENRLTILEDVSGLKLKHHLAAATIHDLYAAGVTYGKRVPRRWGDVVFHPTYEGKMVRAIEEADAPPGVIWIVGSEP